LICGEKLWLAVYADATDRLARLRLLYGLLHSPLLLPSLLLLPCLLLQTALGLPLPPLLYANFLRDLRTFRSSSFPTFALIHKCSYFIARRNGGVQGDAKKLSISCDLIDFISDAPLDFSSSSFSYASFSSSSSLPHDQPATLPCGRLLSFFGHLQVNGVGRGVCGGEHLPLRNTMPTLSTTVQATRKGCNGGRRSALKGRAEAAQSLSRCTCEAERILSP
uniref:Transmembrane protein n=1 Tax=Taenia asiatica TaxID=60517 RepID=A0A0R3WFZ1_TAEAS